MNLFQMMMILVATSWSLGWVNRGFEYPIEAALPFSKAQPHSPVYNLACIVALAAFAAAARKTISVGSVFKHVAQNVLSSSPAIGAAKVGGALLLLWASRWAGRNAGIATDLFNLPILSAVPENESRIEVIQLLSILVILLAPLGILRIHASAVRREEEKKRQALDLSFALAQRRRGIPAPLPGEGVDVTDPSRNFPPGDPYAPWPRNQGGGGSQPQP